MASWPPLSDLLKDWTDDDIVTAVIWGEARGQTYGGLVAVGCVIRNRVNRPRWWGKTYRSVCTKPWQFSCWSDQLTKIMLAASARTGEWPLCAKVAKDIIDDKLPDVTLGADSYYATTIRTPYWAKGLTPIIDIGSHRFYSTVAT